VADNSAAVGLAAFSVCESLILALQDLGLLDERETRGLLEDVIGAHRSAAASSDDPELHEAVAGVVDRILRG
jgi:hypothetical protein